MPQTNVKTGPIVNSCGEDLTNAGDHLVQLSHEAGSPRMQLPVAQDNLTPYLVLEGAGVGGNGSFQPLETGQNIRVPIIGTCNPGDALVLADPAVAGQPGKVTVLPATPGNYRGVGISEELAMDGQHVLIRPLLLGIITIT